MNRNALPQEHSLFARLASACGCILAAAWLICASPALADNPRKLMPTPKSMQISGGEIPLSAEGRIVATEAKLKPLAEIFSREVFLATKLRMAATEGEAKPGDIVLKINPQLRADDEIWTCQNREIKKVRDYAHTIAVTDKAVVEGWDYRAVCEGTATLLQALTESGGKWSLPKMTVKDWPHADFCGFMIDCARQQISLPALKNAIDASRFWKVRHIHLHMNDFNAFVFPIKSYKFQTRYGAINNGDPSNAWDLEELKKTVAYADARGVTLVPELEMPYHADAFGNNIPEIFKGRLIDILNDKTYVVLDKIIGEMCEVFKSSEYFHIGGDEVEFAWYGGEPHVKEWLKKHGVNTNLQDQRNKELMLTYFAKRTNEIVKKYGKKTMFWSGHQGPPHAKELNDCIAYLWYEGAPKAQAAGMPIITVPWGIGVPFPEWNIFHCNGTVLDRNHPVLGHSNVFWEMSQESMMTFLRGAVTGHNVSERQERTWGPDNKIELEEFKKRLAVLDARLGRVVFPVAVKEEAKVEKQNGEKSYFSQPMTLTLSADLPPGCRIRYTLDGSEPTAESPAYEKPLVITHRLRTRAAIFDEAGQRLSGITLGRQWEYQGFQQNLTTGKPVKSSGVAGEGQGAEVPENAVDGWVGKVKPDGSPIIWGAWKPPQWLQVDLQNVYNLDRIEVVPWWQGGRVVQYTVEVSTDEKNWTKVVDESVNTKPENGQGHLHKIAPTKIRSVRVNMLKNSVQDAVQLDEVRVYEVGK